MGRVEKLIKVLVKKGYLTKEEESDILYEEDNYTDCVEEH